MSQQEVADAAGISLSTYRRQEWGDTDNPQIGVIVNLAYVLGCELEDLLEERWLRWRRLPTDRTVISPTKPSDPRKLWRENRTEIHREDQEPLAEKPLPPPPPD